RAKPKDIVTRNGKRRRRATLTDHENVVRVRKRFDLGHLRAGLWTDDDLDAALIEILNGVERLFRIEVCIQNKEVKPGWVRLRASVFEVCCCNPQCGDGIFAERRPRSTQVGEHTNLDGLGPGSLKFCVGTNQNHQHAINNEMEDNPSFHKARDYPENYTRESRTIMLWSAGLRAGTGIK